MIGPLRIIGLTGSIGMGKSLAAAMLRRMGLPVFDSDACARQVLMPGGIAEKQTIHAFPDAIDPCTGTLNRAKLRTLVFEHPERKAVLESIVHPAVRQAQRKFLLHARRTGARAAVLDIPLLFETGAEQRCDTVLCVSAPPFVQRARVLGRPGMDEATLSRILSAQMPDPEKRRRATAIVRTGLGRATTFATLRRILMDLSCKRKTPKKP